MIYRPPCSETGSVIKSIECETVVLSNPVGYETVVVVVVVVVFCFLFSNPSDSNLTECETVVLSNPLSVKL